VTPPPARAQRGIRRRLLTRLHAAIAVVIVVTLALPAVLPASALSTYILLELTAIVTVGVSLLMGCAGQVSLGQGAFYACGAYTAALVALHGLPTPLGLVAAPVVAALLAVTIGVPVLTLRGHHLAFATLAMQLICLSLVGRMSSMGGDIGLQGIPRLSVASFELGEDRDYAYLAWGALALVVVATRNVIRSRPGRALRALASSEVAAESLGVPVGRYKLAVFALAGGFAGLAGGVYAFYMGYVAPASFPLLLSFEYIVMTVVGGLGTISGALVGPAVVTLVVQALNRIATLQGMPSYAPTVLSYAAYSALLVASILFLPDGLVGNKRVRRLLLRLEND
jgi:branched-chain amino acid transport system permease protein